MDLYLSRALAVPLDRNTERISSIDELKYVLTTDYAIKMLNIHERRMCGMPVIIQGETGVGKTFLLQMMSALWNQQLVAELNLIRSRIVDMIRAHLNNFLLECSCGESQSAAINSALDILSETTDKCIPFQVLDEIVQLKHVDSHHRGTFTNRLFYESLLPILLNHRFDPVFMVLSPPDEIDALSFEVLFQKASQCQSKKGVDSIVSPHLNEISLHKLCSVLLFYFMLFIQQKAKAASELLYAFLYGMPICTFYKLSVHAGLLSTVCLVTGMYCSITFNAPSLTHTHTHTHTHSAMKPTDIRKFFKPIVDTAKTMMSAYDKYEQYKRLSPGLEAPDYQQPVITVRRAL